MNNEEIITYALVAIVALAIGYGVSLYMAPPAGAGNGTALTNQTSGTASAVTVNMVQVNKLKTALEGVIKLQSSQDIKLTYNGYSDKGQFVELNFTDDQGRAMPGIQVSRDFQYLYQGATPIGDFATQVTDALAQAAAQQQTPPPTANLTKSDKPNVELFVMSYCPYGTQMEKAMVPVYELLGAKANISIKFVSYTMHGAQETQENARQYCIMQNYPAATYWSYLKCYLADSNGASTCMANLSINATAISSCMATAYSNFGISDSGTAFPIYKTENDLYGVRGSPTLVINGATVSVNRSPQDVKNAICNAFNTPPAECSTALSSTSESPGFGYGAASGTSGTAGCGT